MPKVGEDRLTLRSADNSAWHLHTAITLGQWSTAIRKDLLNIQGRDRLLSQQRGGKLRPAASIQVPWPGAAVTSGKAVAATEYAADDRVARAGPLCGPDRREKIIQLLAEHFGLPRQFGCRCEDLPRGGSGIGGGFGQGADG